MFLKMRCEKLVLKTLLVTIILLTLCEARGGRRGGSFGGLFGSWRKYKKPSSGGGNSRRIVSSSPVHTPITKAWHDSKKPNNNDKFQKNFKPNYLQNTPPLPAGGSYYQNTATLPGNAIYIAQAPPRGAEFGNFLTGYLTGRLLTMGFAPSHHHVTHVYKEAPEAAENAYRSNSTSDISNRNGQPEENTIKAFGAPLMEYPTTTDTFDLFETRNATTQMPLSTNTEPTPMVPLYGVICIPLLVNETNSLGEEEQKEKTVCYPAPAPPVPQKDMKSNPVEIAGDIKEH